MRYELSIDIVATPAQVWAVLVDVERWPQWTSSTTLIRRLDNSAFGVGSTVEICQPRLGAAVWTVTECEPERSFVWATTRAGVTITGGHRIDPVNGDGAGVLVTLDVVQSGPLAGLAGLVTGRLTRQFVQTEARGLTHRCEDE